MEKSLATPNSGSQSFFFLRFDPQLDTPTNFGDILYRDAHVEKMIASEAFCHILQSSRKSIG
jgi:hypothetical protein